MDINRIRETKILTDFHQNKIYIWNKKMSWEICKTKQKLHGRIENSKTKKKNDSQNKVIMFADALQIKIFIPYKFLFVKPGVFVVVIIIFLSLHKRRIY